MARWNGATWRPLGSQSEPKMSAHDVVCAHTMVGSLHGTDSYFAQSGYSGPESHFGVGGKWGADADRKLDGVTYQWQDTLYTADANLEGNHRLISFETADNAPSDPANLQPWTDKQLDALVRGMAWACDKSSHSGCPSGWRCRSDGIPAVLIPDSKPGRRGIGYHRQGCDPWRVSGGEKWSDAYGKVCPGDARIGQLKNIVIPRIVAELGGGPAPQEENDDMFIMWHSNQAYLVGVTGKRKLTPENAAEFERVTGIKDCGAVGSALLNEFPTFDENNSTVGGDTSVLLNRIDAGVTTLVEGA